MAVHLKGRLTEHNCRGGPPWPPVFGTDGWPRRATPTVVTLLALILISSRAQASQPPVLSVLDFGSTPIAKQASETIRARLRSTGELTIADADLSRAAAKGIGYTGSLNMTVSEARDLGAALATEFYILGDAQTVRRSSFESPVYFESYCSIFLVSARTGRLLLWERPSFETPEATNGEAWLSQYLADYA